MDITNGLVSFDQNANGSTLSPEADATSVAFPSSEAGDSIAVSPLAHFGQVVQQIGTSMAADPAASTPGNSPEHARSLGDAMDMLESVVGMMSLYGSPDQMQERLQSGDLPKLEAL